MAVIKKRRTPHSKTSRQQQLQLQQQLRAKQRFENSRLRPEPATTMIHDESDTISYRSYLLMNFINSAEFMDVLMTQPVPNSKIRPPPVFRNSSLEEMKERLAAQREKLASAKKASENFLWALNDDSQFLKDKLEQSEQGDEEVNPILREYLQRFNLRSQEDKVVFHKNKFSHLRGDTREAPPDYWRKHAMMLEEQREKALLLKRQQEEAERERQRLIEEEKKKAEMEETRRQQEREKEQKILEQQREQESIAREEQRREQLQLHLQFQARQSNPGTVSSHTMEQAQSNQHTPYSVQSQSEHSQYQQEQQSPVDQDRILQGQAEKEEDKPQQQQQQSQQSQQKQPDAMDSIFGGFGNEPFNNGFEDEGFDDLDTAFF